MPGESLRDQLTAEFDKHDVAPAAETPAVQAEVPADAPVVESETAPAPEKTAAERARDEKTGQFLPKDAAAAQGKSPSTPPPDKGAKTAPAAATPAAPKAPRPSSWKKELEPKWETLDPDLQAYINERERQYATGVSTYKTEADRAKGVLTALSEFEPALQQAGIPVDKWIQSMGNAHRTLAQGTPQDKMAMVQQILANNRIPAQLAVQGADGQWQLLGAPQTQQQPQQPQFNPQDISKLVAQTVEERLADQEATRAYNAFQQDVSAGKYPQLEHVKETMGRLLETGFAKDYASAYDIALGMPEHRHLQQAAPQQPQPAETEKASEKQKVARARSQAVSVKSSTPSAMTQTEGTKSRRDSVSAAWDSVMGGGRV